MKNNSYNYAYVDAANLYEGVKKLGIDLDYARFRVWLKDKFNITHAYMFIGNIPKNSNLYSYLQESGYILIFKEVVYDNNGKPKGNCDADLVLKATQDFFNNAYDNMLLVSSDGDYSSLVSFIMKENKFLGIVSPANEKKCSVLLKRTDAKIYYISDQREILKKQSKK